MIVGYTAIEKKQKLVMKLLMKKFAVKCIGDEP